MTLARKLGMDSALRGPSWMLPDSNLFALHHIALLPRLHGWLTDSDRRVARAWADILIRIHTQCMGYRVLPKWARYDLLDRPGEPGAVAFMSMIEEVLEKVRPDAPWLPAGRGA